MMMMIQMMVISVMIMIMMGFIYKLDVLIPIFLNLYINKGLLF